MARDHTRVNLGIWGDDEFLDLPVDAQALYWRLWTSPARTYCGAHEWKPGKLAQSAGDWSLERLLTAAAVLSERLFLIIDTSTEECLLRSWIKHDGLWKQPNMAVSMANARGVVASKVLRGVIVHEVRKIAEAEPSQAGWGRAEVKDLLSQRAIDPASLEPFNPGPNGGINTPSDPKVDTPINPYDQPDHNPPSDTPPTTATSTPTATDRGYLSRERHLSVAPEVTPYPNRCINHTYDPNPGNCGPCGDTRRAAAELDRALREAKVAQTKAFWAEVRACPHCGPTGFARDPDGQESENNDRCARHDWSVLDAA